MKVVCIDTDIRNKLGGFPSLSEEQLLEYGKVYEGELIFNIDGIVDWNNNFLNLEGCGELEWFPTKNFVTLEVWREKILSEIGI
jgi:hypothetical protein